MLPLDGGEARQVGGSQRELQALMQWSPDGRRVLLSARTPWSVDADDATDGSNRPWVVTHLPWKLDGSGPQVGHRTVLLAMDVDSGDEQILVCGDFDVVEAAWSPDGKSLAYVRTRDGSQRHRMDLWLADGDGGNARLLTDGLASIAGITWSPDGRTLALGGTVTEGDSLSLLWLVDIADGSLRWPADELQLEGSTIVWHPDGDRVATIAARRGLQEVVVVDVSSGAVTRVDDGLQHAAALCAATTEHRSRAARASAAGDAGQYANSRNTRSMSPCHSPWNSSSLRSAGVCPASASSISGSRKRTSSMSCALRRSRRRCGSTVIPTGWQSGCPRCGC